MDPVTIMAASAAVSTTFSILGGFSEAKARKKQAEAEAQARKLQAAEFRRRADYNIKLQERQGQQAILSAITKRPVGAAGYTRENLDLDYREFDTLSEIIYQAKTDAKYQEQLILSGAASAQSQADNAYSGLFLSSVAQAAQGTYKFTSATGAKWGSSPSILGNYRAPAVVPSKD